MDTSMLLDELEDIAYAEGDARTSYDTGRCRERLASHYRAIVNAYPNLEDEAKSVLFRRVQYGLYEEITGETLVEVNGEVRRPVSVGR